MKTDIDRLARRTRAYWYVDGLAELGSAAVFAGVALVFLVELRAPAGSPLASFSAIALPLVVLVGIWAAGRAVKAAKARLTYPRTGYVAYRQPGRRRRALAFGLALGVAGALLLAWLVLRPVSMGWIPFLDGLAIGLFLVAMAWLGGPVRFYGLALISIALGLASAWASADPRAGTALYFGAMALALAISGGLTLGRYLRATRPGAGEPGPSESQPPRSSEPGPAVQGPGVAGEPS